MSQSNNIAGVVILYNPEKSVKKNIDSYLHQIDYLFILDNSEKSNDFIKEYFSTNQNVEYIFNNGNLGIAAALNIAAGKAMERGYSFLLTMDQDSVAPAEMVKELYEGTKEFDNVGIISPFHDNKFHTKIPSNEKYSIVLDVMMSGNLLNLSAYKDAGDFNENFFIDYVDVEYCLRLNTKKYKVIQTNNVLLAHNEADISKGMFFFRDVYPSNHSAIRFYYKARNRLYLKDIYKNTFPSFFEIEVKMFCSTLLKALLYEKNKILKLKMTLLGIAGYFRRETGYRKLSY